MSTDTANAGKDNLFSFLKTQWAAAAAIPLLVPGLSSLIGASSIKTSVYASHYVSYATSISAIIYLTIAIISLRKLNSLVVIAISLISVVSGLYLMFGALTTRMSLDREVVEVVRDNQPIAPPSGSLPEMFDDFWSDVSDRRYHKTTIYHHANGVVRGVMQYYEPAPGNRVRLGEEVEMENRIDERENDAFFWYVTSIALITFGFVFCTKYMFETRAVR